VQNYGFIIELFFVGALIFLAVRKHDKSKLDKYLIAYLVLQCSGILTAVLGPSVLGLISGSDILFAVSQIIMVTVIDKMILNDTNSARRILWSPIILSVVFLFFCIVPISFADLFNVDFPPPSRTWFTYLQYADFTSIASVILVVNTFLWLYHMILSGEHSKIETERRYLVIFAFLFFYVGTFFILVFGRLLMEDPALWLKIMKSYYRPIYLTSCIIITLAIRWKSLRSLF
jgi:hypothetical protein